MKNGRQRWKEGQGKISKTGKSKKRQEKGKAIKRHFTEGLNFELDQNKRETKEITQEFFKEKSLL